MTLEEIQASITASGMTTDQLARLLRVGYITTRRAELQARLAKAEALVAEFSHQEHLKADALVGAMREQHVLSLQQALALLDEEMQSLGAVAG